MPIDHAVIITCNLCPNKVYYYTDNMQVAIDAALEKGWERDTIEDFYCPVCRNKGEKL